MGAHHHARPRPGGVVGGLAVGDDVLACMLVRFSMLSLQSKIYFLTGLMRMLLGFFQLPLW